MAKRIYKKRSISTDIIKVRLQHTEPGDELSLVLEELADHIDKTQLYSFSGCRLGTNPKYEGSQATAIYLEIDAQTLRKMFQFLTLNHEAV